MLYGLGTKVKRLEPLFKVSPRTKLTGDPTALPAGIEIWIVLLRGRGYTEPDGSNDSDWDFSQCQNENADFFCAPTNLVKLLR